MKKFFRLFLTSDRKRRCLAVGAALWLLRLIRDVEYDEMQRNSDMLDNFDPEDRETSRRDYSVIEERYLSCECAFGVLDSAIEDIEFTY